MNWTKDSFLQRILSRTVVQGECLVYTWGKDADGYGRIAIPESLQDIIPYKQVRVHRAVFYLFWGETELGILHTCDNRPCIRIEHLFAGTNDDNVKDAARKGRMSKGDNHHRALLTEQNVRDIKAFLKPFARNRAPVQELAIMFGVKVQVIQRIRCGKSWRHID